MNNLVQLAIDNDVAVITVNNPPVNALSVGVPEGIIGALHILNANPHVTAAVLIGAGRTFVAGADIKEFANLVASISQNGGVLLRNSFAEVALAVEDSKVPIIVAIHGTALGGGLELAMAGAYRVALANSRVGQPEVKLGIIPGAGGTQRLPRLAGMAKALAMCADGNPIGAEEGLRVGIIDRLVIGNTYDELLIESVAVAKEMRGKPWTKTRELSAKLGTMIENAPIFAAARDAAARMNPGQRAPLAAIEAVEASATMSFFDGFALEQRLFAECLVSAQSKALIHVFFSEREATKVPDIPMHTVPVPIATPAVVGAGEMGRAIAMTFANGGIPLALKGTDRASLDQCMDTIRLRYADSVTSGRLTQDAADERLARIEPTLNYQDLSDADLVVEAAQEEMSLTKKIFAELDSACKAGAILATSTSILNIDEIASAVTRPEDILGLHFPAPINATRLIEIGRGKKSSPAVIVGAMLLARRLGKAVTVSKCLGSVGNRLLRRYWQQAQLLVDDGATIEEVDRALTEFGMAVGPFESMEAYDEQLRAMPYLEVTAPVGNRAAGSGIRQCDISTQEILDRTVWALVNEGARALEEECVERASDIDTLYVNGYGFPAWRGGPMWYADQVGLDKVYERICHFHQRCGEFWRPAPLLKKLAERQRGFYGSGSNG